MDILRAGMIKLYPIVRSIHRINLSKISKRTGNSLPAVCCIHTSSVKHDLNEFFDDENFDTNSVGVGRPWRKDELRIKSNQDLHKLWYVLLKERNLVLTMEHMYNKVLEPITNPERLEKVEESMENILEVTKERNIAYELLEYGETDEPKKYVTRNAVGIPYEKTPKEHYLPKHLNKRFQQMHSENQRWMNRYLALYEEKYRRQRNYKARMHEKKRKEMIEEFEMEEDEIPERLDHSDDKLEEYLVQTTELNDVNRDGR